MTITLPQQATTTLLSSPFFQTGFLSPAPHEPINAEWETLLARAMALPLKVADASPEAESWRQSIRNLHLLPLASQHLAHAHSTLTFLSHFYMHSLPLNLEEDHRVLPPGLSIPLLRTSKALNVPPVLSYADTVFYNLAPAFFSSIPSPESPSIPSLDQVRATFSNTPDEAHFYLTSARIEDVGVEAMRCAHTALSSLSSAAEGGEMAAPLRELSGHIREMTRILDSVRDGCEPGVYYDSLRPWMRAPEADLGWRLSFSASSSVSEIEELEGEEWVDHVDWDEGEVVLKKGLAGATAAQSSIIQAMDAVLGLEHEPNGFLHRMRAYLPRAHREFIEKLGEAGAQLRSYISTAGQEGERTAYNACVDALKEMRTVHVRIAALYLVTPAPRVVGRVEKGTGGTAAIPFLKGVRDRTARAVV